MPAPCSNCGIEQIDRNLPCPLCGRSNDAVASRLVGSDRFAAAFAYFTFIPAAIFLSLSRFKANRFVRFHSFQSIFLFVVACVFAAILRVALAAFSFIPFLIAALIVTISCLGCFMLWIVLLVKAFQGRKFKLPWIGDFAEERA